MSNTANTNNASTEANMNTKSIAGKNIDAFRALVEKTEVDRDALRRKSNPDLDSDRETAWASLMAAAARRRNG